MRPEQNPDIKLVTIDIDRTLIDDNTAIPEVNKKAIQDAKRSGCHVVLCSGRSGASVRMYMEELGLDEVVPSLGGCMLAKWDRSEINNYGIDCDTALVIYDIARKYDIYPYVFRGESWLSDPENVYWNKKEYDITKIVGNILDLRKFLETNRPNKMLVPTMNSSIINTVMEDLRASVGDKIVCFLSSPYYIEVMPKGVNKGTAVKDLVKYFNITKENVLAIGDYYNDVDMFNAAGNTAAVFNAPDDIKAMVDYVSPLDNNKGAVAEIINKYVLKV